MPSGAQRKNRAHLTRRHLRPEEESAGRCELLERGVHASRLCVARLGFELAMRAAERNGENECDCGDHVGLNLGSRRKVRPRDRALRLGRND